MIWAAPFVIVLGIAAAADLLVPHLPILRQVLAKITPYRGWFGAVSALWGIWIVIWTLLSFSLFRHWPLIGVTMLAMGLLTVAIGLLLGIDVLRSLLRHPAASQRMQELARRLAPLRGTLGLTAIGLGVWALVANLIW